MVVGARRHRGAHRRRGRQRRGLALWTVTRTAGLPFGPEAGHPESVGVLDVVAVADELLFAACAVALMHDRGHLLRHPVVIRAALIASLAAAMLAGGHPH
jgi:hypothetical protein